MRMMKAKATSNLRESLILFIKKARGIRGLFSFLVMGLIGPSPLKLLALCAQKSFRILRTHEAYYREF